MKAKTTGSAGLLRESFRFKERVERACDTRASE